MSALAWAALAVAGGLGACARLLVDGGVAALVRRRQEAGRWVPGVPAGTLVVNVTACLLLGVVAGLPALPPTVAAVLGTGLLGGYSTFSTASVEGARLVLEGRWAAGAAHAAGMVLVTVAAALAGLALAPALAGA